MGIKAKYSPEHGVVKARQSYNGYIACWEHPKGNEPNRIHFASMCVEHCLKALISHERGVSAVPHGHDLAHYMHSLPFDLSSHDELVYMFDGMSVYSRYDEVDEKIIDDPEEMAQELMNFIRTTERICGVTHN
jgi:hypothetical protein